MDEWIEARINRAARKLAASPFDIGAVYVLLSRVVAATGHDAARRGLEACIRAHNIRQFELLLRPEPSRISTGIRCQIRTSAVSKWGAVPVVISHGRRRPRRVACSLNL